MYIRNDAYRCVTIQSCILSSCAILAAVAPHHFSPHLCIFTSGWHHVWEQVVVPGTYTDLTRRRVLTSEWIDGEKLSQSDATDVGDLVNVGVISYLKQLLDTGFFHVRTLPPFLC